ncbi:disease resistance-like protein DSC1 [Rosa rugosa]|uniref:disease resistance-like protein DSC1 n=1 Tax=Rosa rugosa TaxID=74645 RepID=UPI002B402320|nr:disease resistance-like protein DSC1 [Rosa rugosa]
MTGVISVDLSDCHCLVSLPTDICELKSLQRLDLSRCRRFTKFPEIAEPMEHLQYLNLRETKIEELPSSVGNLVGLKTLDLSHCTSLELLPNSFYNLNLLEWFSLERCYKLNKLPLSFILCSLVNLNLGSCKLLEEIPDCFTSFPALQVLDLSHTMIETIPPSIKQVSRLKHLFQDGCEWLQSLPVLPCLLKKLGASKCTRLKTVSVSVTAQTEGLDQIVSEKKRTERHTYYGCDSLYKNARSNIMDDAHFRIMQMATACNLKRLSSGKVELMCPGLNEIPKWFSCQMEGYSMNIKLPLHWSDDSNFLGIALCSVSAIHEDLHHPEYQCEMILKTNNGETHSVNLGSSERFGTMDLKGETDHVFVWYNKVHEISDEAKWSLEASFDFYIEQNRERSNNVKRCGVCFLYAQGQDDDAPKFEVIRPQQLTTTRRRRGRFEDDASGSQLFCHCFEDDAGSETYGEYDSVNIQTVPSSSFMCMTRIISLDLSNCDRLLSLPTDICKLKSLERLNLSSCCRFTKFPEIVERTEHLQYLNLSQMNIKKLPSSIGNLVGLKILILTSCKSLELLPDSFYNLNLLKWFSLEGCVKLEKLPVSFILCCLINLSLRGCILLEEIPDCFNSFPTLQVLDLSETMIETIPPSIKQVFGLKSLLLDQCKRLQSLPVLPCLLEEFDARECWRLKTVPVSVTAQTQGLDQVLSGKRYEIHSFVGCVNLDNNSRSNIMDDAHIRIM